MVLNQLPQKKSTYSEASGVFGLLAVCLISVAFVLQVFGVDFVRGSGPFWQSQIHDVTQYIAGFNMYFGAPWQLPLLAFDSLNYPIGTRVTFVDAIPIYALLLKLVVPLGWAPFNPFGFWVGLCFLMQGFSAWWICRELKAESWPLLLGLLAALLTFPALLARLGHISLMSHWILLFAIALYIRGFKKRQLPCVSWAALIISAFYINIYIFVMASGIAFASLFDLNRRLTVRDLGIFLLPFVLLGATLFVMLLPLPIHEITPEWGFGYYSMNLISPILGGALIPIPWSVEIGQEFEGFNYLGLGTLFAGVIVLIVNYKIVLSMLLRHWPLMSLLFVFTIYALSNKIYFGTIQVVEFNYPEFLSKITSQFRASGRFFWPVGYCITILVFYGLFKSFKHRYLIVLVAFSILVQAVDLTGRFEKVKGKIKERDADVVEYIKWDRFLSGYPVDTIYLYPKFKCDDQNYQNLLALMRYAADRALNINTGYVSRYTPDCSNIQSEIFGSDFDHSIYVFTKEKFSNRNDFIHYFPKSKIPKCTEIDFAYACVTDSKDAQHVHY